MIGERLTRKLERRIRKAKARLEELNRIDCGSLSKDEYIDHIESCSYFSTSIQQDEYVLSTHKGAIKILEQTKLEPFSMRPKFTRAVYFLKPSDEWESVFDVLYAAFVMTKDSMSIEKDKNSEWYKSLKEDYYKYRRVMRTLGNAIWGIDKKDMVSLFSELDIERKALNRSHIANYVDCDMAIQWAINGHCNLQGYNNVDDMKKILEFREKFRIAYNDIAQQAIKQETDA